MRIFSLRSIAGAMAVCALTFAVAVSAQNSSGPQPVPLPPPIATPLDTPYPGTISLMVDLTDTVHRVVRVHESVPVRPGQLTLLYPEWLPGTHSPTGPIAKMAGLMVSANGRPVPWTRDRVNIYAFHMDVPQGVKSLDVDFDYLAAVRSREGRVEISSEIADMPWNSVVLYPAGHFSRQILFAPSVLLPKGWKFATALETKSQADNLVHFQDTPLNTLVDSPLYAGENYKRVDLSTGPDNKVYLDVFADTPAELEMTPEELQAHRNLAIQAQKLFASHHYNHYDFLFSLSDVVGGNGLEHHQSSEDGTRSKYFTDWAGGVMGRDLLAHEYTHSWNGKFRRPADLWTPNFNVPMQDDLLWVYEGLTEYYGYVLTARSGMRTPEQTRDMIAQIAANFEDSPGRTWRPLVDTTLQPIISERRPVSWVSWQRQEDYYMEGLLVWLDTDTKIRQLSGGKKSLDDFARLFYGIDNGSFVTHTYVFDDVVNALGKVWPYDWAGFLHDRVYKLAPQVPENGTTQGGYRLVYNDTEPEWMKKADTSRFGTSFATSLGFSVMKNGDLGNVWWDSVAYKAGITPDMQLMGVNGETYTPERLRAAILQAEKDKAPITLLMKQRDLLKTFQLDYHNGMRWPHLERVAGTPDLLDSVLAPVQ